MNPSENGNTQTGFELSSQSTLKTAKSIYIKESFSVKDNETHIKNGQKFSRTYVTQAIYSLAIRDYLVGIGSLGVAPSIGLPLPSLAGIGKAFIIKDEVGGAGTTTITIRSEGEKTIDGATSTTIATNYGTKSFYSDGSNWFTY